MLAESDSLERYLSSSIQRVPYGDGAGLATDEIRQGYLDFCRAQHWNPQMSGFDNRLPKLMAKFFGASRTNNLKRYAKKNTRGYRMVAFIEDPQPTEDDWTPYHQF
jgi:hypothetical protein